MRIAMIQANPTVGDLKGNFNLLQQEVNYAVQHDCDVVVFPELFSVAYPPRDLLYSPEIWRNHKRFVEKVEAFVKSLDHQITVIFGGLDEVHLTHGRFARRNAAFIIDKIEGTRVVHKRLLPCYDVFDETRYFAPDTESPYIPVRIWMGARNSLKPVYCDVLICEDIWNYKHRSPSWMSPASYGVDPVSELKGDGPIIVLNGSPWWEGKINTTISLLKEIATDLDRPICWVNQVGAHDDIITGGYSMFFTSNPTHFEMAKAFAEDRLIVRCHTKHSPHSSIEGKEIADSFKGMYSPKINGEQITSDDFNDWCLYSALRLHLIDYFRRTGHKTAVFGASGGIDSAVVGAIAAEALGPARVTAVTMPSSFSSEGSWKDAESLAEAWGMPFKNWNIASIYDDIRSRMINVNYPNFQHGVTDENIQPRIRGLLLMMYSNDNPGCLVLATGNKSELSVGYCTLYGDMCGGLAVINDVPKTRVYDLARFIVKYFGEDKIPAETINKPPSAELRPDQVDTDSLPPYDQLDAILEMIVERDMTLREVKEQADAPEWVEKINRMVNVAEYKRFQSPLGAKVRERSFGSGRRVPIAKNVRLI